MWQPQTDGFEQQSAGGPSRQYLGTQTAHGLLEQGLGAGLVNIVVKTVAMISTVYGALHLL